MSERGKLLLQTRPGLGPAQTIPRQILFEPVQKQQPDRFVLSFAHRLGDAGLGMNPIVRPALRRGNGRLTQEYLDEQRHVFIGATKTRLRAADLNDCVSPNHDVGRARHGPAAQRCGQKQQLGRFEQLVAGELKPGHVVALTIGGIAGPAIPVEWRSVDSFGAGMCVEKRHLFVQLRRTPGVVGIEESDQRAAGPLDTQPPRHAHPTIDVPFMFCVANTIRPESRCRERHRGASVSRTVIDEDQLPVIVGLSEHARDRLFHEALGVQKNCHDGNTRRGCHRWARSTFARGSEVGQASPPGMGDDADWVAFSRLRVVSPAIDGAQPAPTASTPGGTRP